MIDKQILKYILLSLVFSLMFSSLMGQNNFPDEKEIRKMIRKDENCHFRELVQQGLINENRITEKPLLFYAIRYGNNSVLKCLLDHKADPNTYYRGRNMLMWAVRYNRPNATRLLLEYGANIDASDDKGTTAIMMAAWMNRTLVMKVLIEFGTDIYQEDNSGSNSVEVAIYEGKESTGFAMDSRKFMRNQIEPRHDYIDGPYVTYLSDSLAKVLYTYYDTYEEKVVRVDSLFKTKQGSFGFKGFVFDTLTYDLELPVEPQEAVFEGVKKVFAINDVHGHYQKFVQSLQENNIIDKKLNWNFGKGHLVINGDVFDRGNGVTETLWLIYQLEKQARKEGGYVHFLLGNHEIMILENDTRYLSKKYKFFVNYFGWNYAAFFTKDSFFGKWLRAHNSIVKINDDLFVHGGISFSFYQEKMSVKKINEQVRYKLNNYLVNESELLFSMNGPFWYRGYLWKGKDFELINELELDIVLDYYDVSKIIVGHTYTEQIQALFNGKVIALSAPFCKKDEKIFGLLIKNGKYYKMSGKEKYKLFD